MDHEATVEVECFGEDEELKTHYKICQKNPGHKHFIRMCDLCLDDLPKRIKHKEVLETIQLCSKLVVRIVVDTVSPKRPESDQFYHLAGTNIRRTASGFVRTITSHGTSRDNSSQGSSGYAEIDIITNKHVVYDDIEAEQVTVELFYDSFNKKGVQCLKGLRVTNSSDFLDVSHVTCVCRDGDLINSLLSYKTAILNSLANIPPHVSKSGMCIIISHPHGLPKSVSIGDVIEQDVPEFTNANQIWTWSGTLKGSQDRVESQLRMARSSQRVTYSRKAEEKKSTGIVDVSQKPQRQYKHVKPLGDQDQRKQNLHISRSDSALADQKNEETCTEGGRQICRYVSRYSAATCPGSSGGPVLLQLGSSEHQLDCYIHSRHDRKKKLNLSLRKNKFS